MTREDRTLVEQLAQGLQSLQQIVHLATEIVTKAERGFVDKQAKIPESVLVRLDLALCRYHTLS